MNVAGLIVLYSPNENMLDNINRLASVINKLIIVDNTENDVRYFSDSECIEYIKNYSNVGLASALNFGFKRIVELGFEWAIYFDQDTIFTEQIISEFIEKIKFDNNVAIYSPLYDIDRKKTPKTEDKFSEVTYTMTSSSVFNLNVMKKIDFFDERYFIDVVDYAYCLKAKKNGYKIMRYYGFKIKHSPGITKKTKSGKKYGYMSPIRFYYQIRNLHLLFHDFKKIKILLIILWKYYKVLMYFENKKEFWEMRKKAIFDYKNSKFYKINI